MADFPFSLALSIGTKCLQFCWEFPSAVGQEAVSVTPARTVQCVTLIPFPTLDVVLRKKNLKGSYLIKVKLIIRIFFYHLSDELSAGRTRNGHLEHVFLSGESSNNANEIKINNRYISGEVVKGIDM